MRPSYVTGDEQASLSIDLLSAIAVIIIGFVFAVNIISSLITPYSGYSKELYPAADRAITLLIESEGYWDDGNEAGRNWEDTWVNQNYSEVKKIGLLARSTDKANILDGYKIYALMDPINTIEGAWEYPVNSTTGSEGENASRAIGLGRYSYYLQIRPLDENSYNTTEADQRATEAVEDGGDVVSVVRHSISNNVIFKDFDGYEFFGSYNPRKVVFVVGYEDYTVIEAFGALKFSITNWNVIDNNGAIQNIEISDKIKNNATQFGVRLTGADMDLWKNEKFFNLSNTSSSVGMPIQNSTDYVTIEILKQSLDEKLPGWEHTQEFYIQMNVDKIEISDPGITWYETETYPAKIVLWVW